jgi:PBSX family phage terminase large subunit
MPRSFVDQAMARTLSYSNAKIWFNCNPESPNHWFYKEWISNTERKFKHLLFLMRDNPILSEKEIQRAESLFTGVFYDRYIRGLWVRAEGIIFQDLANDASRWIVCKAKVPRSFQYVEVGFDIGGNGSAYAMTCTGRGFDGNQY